MFSCEFCQISKNNFLHRTPLVAASAKRQALDELQGDSISVSKNGEPYVHGKQLERLRQYQVTDFFLLLLLNSKSYSYDYFVSY